MFSLKKSCSKNKIHIENNTSESNIEVVPNIEQNKKLKPLSESAIANFTCPISFEIMTDPVITKEGNTFERSAILNWLKGKNTCPLSRLPLFESDLITNKSLKEMIERYRENGLLPKLTVSAKTYKSNLTSTSNVLNTSSRESSRNPVTVQRRTPGLWTPTNNSSTSAYVSMHQVVIQRQSPENIQFNEIQNIRQRERPIPYEPLILPILGTFNSEELEPVDIPVNPDFSFLDSNEKNMIQSAYKTLNRLNKWDYMRRYNPSNQLGYMFDKDETIDEITNAIDNDYQMGHSGFSMAFTMRNIQYIAKNGFEKYKEHLMEGFRSR